jgi:ABC-type sugar transport system ATPase subunit
MAFGLKLRKFPKAEIQKRVNDAAGILGLEQLLDRKPKALSGGHRLLFEIDIDKVHLFDPTTGLRIH